MGMVFYGNWNGLEFPKFGKDIVQQAEKKVEQLEAKIKERQERIKTLTEQHGINVTDLLSNLDSLSGNATSNNQFGMNVGQQEQLKAEARAIKEEKTSLDQLNLIVRNLPKEQTFKLTFQQLEYLDF